MKMQQAPLDDSCCLYGWEAKNCISEPEVRFFASEFYEKFLNASEISNLSSRSSNHLKMDEKLEFGYEHKSIRPFL